LSLADTHGTVLAFDLGLKRTGVASGELSIGVAHPLTVIQADSTDARLAAIARLIAEWQPVLLVLGLPTHADGSEHEMTRVAKNFARKLESRFKLPV
jgi:putative Holliday junction resolvase